MMPILIFAKKALKSNERLFKSMWREDGENEMILSVAARLQQLSI